MSLATLLALGESAVSSSPFASFATARIPGAWNLLAGNDQSRRPIIVLRIGSTADLSRKSEPPTDHDIVGFPATGFQNWQ
jgi:hypothetical protein